MGAIHFSVDLDLIRMLRSSLPLDIFVETGTFRGATTESVASFFEKIYTVEMSGELFRSTSDRLSQFGNIEMIKGSSPEVIEQLHPLLKDQAVVYWLDAHWCGATTAGAESECPLLAELGAIRRLNASSVILIDDARLFLAPPPHPHNPSDWPTMSEVVHNLEALSREHTLCMINDVFVFAPEAIADQVIRFSRNKGIDLLTTVNASGKVRLREKKLREQLTKMESEVRQLKAAAADRQELPVEDSSNSEINIAANKSGLARFNLAFLRDNRSEQLFSYHLHRLDIRRVLDIGSNTGQFVQKLRKYGFNGVVYSVEPQLTAYNGLLENSRLDSQWIPLAQQGAGSIRQQLNLNISANSWSSSLLEVHQNHINADQSTQTVEVEPVNVNISGELLKPDIQNKIEAIKIDVQGFELEVIKGYLPKMSGIRLLMLELSMVECYKNSPDMFELDRYIVQELDFSRISLEPSYYDDTSGVVQQYDGIYFRPRTPECKRNALGIKAINVVTSIGGSTQRFNQEGTDVGAAWFDRCQASWTRYSRNVFSISENKPVNGEIQWVKTETRPRMSAIFDFIADAPADHSLVVNADIALTPALENKLEALDPDAVYYIPRDDLNISGDIIEPLRITTKKPFDWGFDVFLLPRAFAEFLKSKHIFPEEYAMGLPWWDYLLPVVALGYGFPLKKLRFPDTIAEHFAHEAKYSNQVWDQHHALFWRTIETMQRDSDCVAQSLLFRMIGHRDSGTKGFLKVRDMICKEMP